MRASSGAEVRVGRALRRPNGEGERWRGCRDCPVHKTSRSSDRPDLGEDQNLITRRAHPTGNERGAHAKVRPG